MKPEARSDAESGQEFKQKEVQWLKRSEPWKELIHYQEA